MEEKKVFTWWPIWFIVKTVARSLRIVVAWREEYGKENIPQTGMLIEHCSHFTTAEEAGIIFDLSPRRLYLMYKKDLETGTNLPTRLAGYFVKFFLRGAGFIPTERGVKDGGTAVAQARWALKQGHAVLAMPERTSRQPVLIEASGKGTARLAMELDCPIQPIAVIGAPHAITHGLLAWLRLYPRQKLHIIYGLPFRFSQLGLNLENDPTGKNATTACMVRIGAMLPKQFRGFYTQTVEEFLTSDAFDIDYYRKLQTSLDLLG